MSDPLGGFLEGLLQGGVQGYEFRQGLHERKRRRATEDEDRTYERARRLREDVGFQLQQRLGEGQLAGQEHVAGQRRRIAASAAQIREQLGTDPRFQHIALLPDEDVVREFGDLVGRPESSGTDPLYSEPGEPVGFIDRGTAQFRPVTRDGRPLIRPRHTGVEQRQDLATVERQVDDTRADVARAERERPQRPMFFLSPADSTGYVADSAASAARVGGLRERADSLGVVRDSLAAAVQGRPFRRPVGRPTPDTVLQDLGRRFNWDEAKIRAELVRLGYDPDS